MVLLLCLFLIGIPIVLLIWINQLFTTYKITNQRIILGSGIILRRIDEVELYRVKDVRVDFSLLNQLVNI
ncbi:PH domain-containing protein, partial [Stenotrophomonas maltophilia]|uniref:PH domain-containing protein n=1 Tax=Stenotrophomonas maltophilia TaxID=40324 RepID=UPI0019535BE1